MAIQRIRVWCQTENAEKFWYLPTGTPIPTKCPDNSGHTVDAAKTAVMNVGGENFQLDNENAQIVRSKQCPTGWFYHYHPIEIETSTGSIYEKKATGVDYGFTTVTRFDAGGAVTTNEVEAVTTQMDWEPNHPYEILGGELRCLEPPTADTRVWCIAAPLVPEAMGGSKEMCSGFNLAYLESKGLLKIDGRVAKHFEVDSTYHVHRFRFLFKHPAGQKTKVQIVMETFKK
jgi:hypothetical protein